MREGDEEEEMELETEMKDGDGMTSGVSVSQTMRGGREVGNQVTKVRKWRRGDVESAANHCDNW